MGWEVEFTGEFERWWTELEETAQRRHRPSRASPRGAGPTLPFPHSSDVRASRHGNMRELRVQVAGGPYRVFYAFDPRRTAILLIGGNKAGDERFYDRMVPIADTIYGEHLEELKREERSTGDVEEK